MKLLNKSKAYFFKVLEYLVFNQNYITSAETILSKKSVYKGVRIHGKVFIDEGCKIINNGSIKTASKIKIGKFTSINGPNTDLFAQINQIIIGNYCSIARNVSIQEFNHNYNTVTTYPILQNIFGKEKAADIYSNGDIVVGHDVWIGTQCVILSGSKIGSGAVVAANSVVSGEIPPYAIVGGSPAKLIKYRFDRDIIDALLKLEWWNWPNDRVIRNKSFFEGELSLEKLNNVVE